MEQSCFPMFNYQVWCWIGVFLSGRTFRILCKINKGMYGLPHAGRFAYIKLIQHLQKHGYIRAGLTSGLFRHVTRNIIFSLVVDDFGIKYTNRDDAQHLIDTLKKEYPITIDWDASIFLGMHLKWDYTNCTVTISMPGYVKTSLIHFNHAPSKSPQHLPHPYTQPTYGAKVQYAKQGSAYNLTPEQLKYAQQVIGVFLFYARTIDTTMLPAIGSIATNLSTSSWADTNNCMSHFLNYAATHPDAQITYKASDMHHWTHTNSSYLTEPKAQSQAGGYHYFSDKPTLPIKDTDPAPMQNHPIHVICKVIDAVMSSTQEAETGDGYINACESIPICQTAIEMGHPQGPTQLQFDNKCAHGIITGELKQKQSKSMDMCFHWLRDRANQQQFHVHWKHGETNLGDYPTTHHLTKHHKNV